jgi:TRAP-type C4-dicarboxylate transport system permease small subunit
MKKKITPKSIVTNLDAIITGTTLTLCVILVNLNVIFRYFLKSPINWTDEVVTSLFVWTVFMGSAYAHRKHSHLGVDIVVNLIHGKSRETIEFVMSILEILVLALLTYISSQYVYNLIYSRGVLKLTLTDTLRIPKWYTGVAVPLGFGLSLIYQIYFFLRDNLHVIKKKEAPAQGDTNEEGGAR